MKRQLFLVLLVLGGLLPLVNTAAATHDPNDFFVTEATFPGISWNDVHGAGGVVMAVGLGSSGPAIAIRSGGVWTLDNSIFDDIEGIESTIGMVKVWMVSSTLAYTVSRNGNTGAILKWDSGTWSVVTGYDASFVPLSVAARSSTDILFGGYIVSGLTFLAHLSHFTGTVFDTFTACLSTETSVDSIFPISSSTGYRAIHSSSLLLDVVSGASIANPATYLCGGTAGAHGAYKKDVWGAATAYTVGLGGTINRNEIPDNSPTTNTLNSIHGVAENDLWAVGDAGTIIHRVTSWTLEPTTASVDLRGIYFSDAANGWAVGTGGIIQKLQINPAVAAPLVPVGMVHSDLAELETQNTNCIGAWAPFSIVNDLAPLTTIGDGDLYIYSRAAGVWVFQIDDALWTPAIPALPASQAAWTSVLLPPGDYYALLLLDITGVGAIDLFDADVFTVSASPCTDNPTDLGPVLNHIQYNQAQENATQLQLNHTDNNVTHIHAEQHNQHSITNARINTTFLSLYAQVNAAWARTNTTCQKTIYSMAGCEGLELLIADVCQTGNCNFTVNNTPVLQALEAEKVRLLGFDSPETWTMLLFGALMVWALHKKWFFVAGVAMIGMISVILGTAGTWDSTGWTIAILLLLVPAYWLELWMANRHQRHSDHDAAEGSA